MCRTIEAGGFPVAVKAFYVFGSYARGALEPHDLDVILIYEKPSKEDWQRFEERLLAEGRYDSEIAPAIAFSRWMRDPLKKRGERVDILLDHSFETFEDWSVAKGAILLWSPESPNFEEKIAAILPDPKAGRFERNYLCDIRRVHSNFADMTEITELVGRGAIKLTRIPVETIDLRLNAFHKRELEISISLQCWSKKTAEVAAYAMWWLQQRRKKFPAFENETRFFIKPYYVDFGKPFLSRVAWRFSHAAVKEQCLIPHFRAKGPNELLVFERGPSWAKKPAEE